MNSRNSSRRIVTTRKAIDSAQVMPPDGSRKLEKSACHCPSTHEMAVYSQSSNGGLLIRPAEIRRGGSVGAGAGACWRPFLARGGGREGPPRARRGAGGGGSAGGGGPRR